MKFKKMNLITENMKLYQNLYFKNKKLYNLKMRNKDSFNHDINAQKSKKFLYVKSNKITKNNSPNYSENSSINSEDINYKCSPSLKDRILSPGDDDICIPKKGNIKKDIFQEDDICFYEIKNINFQYQNNNKKLLLLDLDETLVHSSFQPLGRDKNNQIIQPDIFLKILFEKKYYNLYVLTRPYINQFLKDMSKLFIIYIFTASIQEYANPLLNEIDKNNIISHRLYRDSCTLTTDGKYVKNLNILNYNLKDLILLDNNPISYSFNKNNGIPIKSWHNDKNDKELIKIGNFLNFLSTVDDVRYYIPRVVEKDEINYYKLNIMISQRINSKFKEDIKYSQIDKKKRNKYFNFNSSVDSTTPRKKINFNNDKYVYAYTKTESNTNNNKSPINFREPKSNNRIPKNKNEYLNLNKNKHLNQNNNIKININSINFNLDKKMQKLKKSKTDNKNEENKDININKSFNKVSINNVIKNKNFFHKHRLSANNLILNNALNRTNLAGNKDIRNNYSNINNSSNNENNISNYYSYHSCKKKKKNNSIYGYNLKKKNFKGKNIRNILEDNDYYDLNLNKEKNIDLIINNNNQEKTNIKNSNNVSNNSYYNKTAKPSTSKYRNNLKLKAYNFDNLNGNINIKRNENFKVCKTFCDKKENDILIGNNKNIENGKNEDSIFTLFKQKFLEVKEPVKIKILRKENKPDMINCNNNKLKKENRINSKDYIGKKSNYYHNKKNGLVKERSCTEFMSNFDFYNNYINEKEKNNYISNIASNFSNKVFHNQNINAENINYNNISNYTNLFN